MATRDLLLDQLAPILDYLRAEESMHALIRSGFDEDDLGWLECENGAPHWDLAAEFAHEILKAANRDGMGGCRLCRS